MLNEHGFNFSVGGLKRDLESLNSGNAYSNARSNFWVAVDNERVIGTVAIREKQTDIAELKRLYLNNEYRGRGLGLELYLVAENYARDKGYKYIWLDSSRRFKNAAQLYYKNGFRLLEELDNDWEDNIYQKQL